MNARFRSAVCRAMAVICVAWAATAVHAQDDAPVESGRDALTGGVQSLRPWYDAETDTERAVDLPKQPETKSNTASTINAPAFSALMVVFWVIVGVILVLLVLALIYVFLTSENRKAHNVSGVAARPEFDLARVEELPFDLDRSAEDLLGEARRQRDRGDLRQAIIYLFSYQLLELDRRHAIRLTRGKTNRQYLRELPQARSRLRQLLALSIETFEEAFFGARQPDSRRFDACWSALDEFIRLAAEGTV